MARALAGRATLTPATRIGTLALFCLIAACGRDGGRDRNDNTALAPHAVAPGDTLELDRWNLDEVVVRLEQAGLVVERTGERAAHPALSAEAELLRVGGSDLLVFLYPDAQLRRTDGAELGERIEPDTAAAARPGRVIATNNLTAIYYPRTELQHERVTNVLLARYTEDR